MLKPGPTTYQSLAWLLDSQARRCIQVEGRSNTAKLDGLSFYAPDFARQNPEPWLIGREVEFESVEQVPLPPLKAKAEPQPAAFARMIEDILVRIQQDEFQKVVPMVHEDFEFEASLNPEMFRRAVLENQYSYGFSFEEEGMAGITPELLFESDGQVVHTMALAGTGRADGPSLLKDQKERHEHQLVIDHIVAELNRFGKVQTDDTFERVYGPLKHLYTPIELKLEQEAGFEDLVAALHPTAALGGWPRKAAVSWLERQAFHLTRRRFGAPFGYNDGHQMKCVVAIRNVQWQGACMQLSSGCGVVQESETLREWKELALKRQAIFKLLNLKIEGVEI